MSAHESMEQADQAKEASHENRNIALLIAIIALCLCAVGDARQGRADRDHRQECRSLEPLGVLPGQEHPPHHGADRGRTGQARPRRRRRRCREGRSAEADRRLAEDRAALPLRARDQGRHRATGRARQGRRRRARPRARQNTITTNWRPPRSRSASCWRRRPSSPASIALAWISGLLTLVGIAFIGLRPVHAASAAFAVAEA